MRTLEYHVAITLDGFLAHPDGTWDGFPVEGEHATDFFEAQRGYDVVLMGRKTYEVGVRMGVTSPYPTMRQYVFSRSMPVSPDPAVTLVRSDAVATVRQLKEEGGRPAWLCGGGELAATLMDAGLIDRIVVKLAPLVLGAGIPMFARAFAHRALELVEQKPYASGVQRLTYRVGPPAERLTSA